MTKLFVDPNLHAYAHIDQIFGHPARSAAPEVIGLAEALANLNLPEGSRRILEIGPGMRYSPRVAGSMTGTRES